MPEVPDFLLGVVTGVVLTLGGAALGWWLTRQGSGSDPDEDTLQ